jgi:hypothetical protein
MKIEDITVGLYVQNTKTKHRADVMVIGAEQNQVKVLIHPSDVQGNYALAWQIWDIQDIELCQK